MTSHISNGKASPNGQKMSRSQTDREPPNIRDAADEQPAAKLADCNKIFDEELRQLCKKLIGRKDRDNQETMWEHYLCDLYKKCDGDAVQTRKLFKDELESEILKKRRNRNDFWSLPIGLIGIAIGLSGLAIGLIGLIIAQGGI